jgi:uncharacterized membrane protein YeaQ/YmgE (transglycosylase-associated protein family)
MQNMSLLGFLFIGAIAGWLGGLLMRGGGFGLFGNIGVGIVGAFIGGYVFSFLGISAGGTMGALTMATVGAIVLLFIVGLMKRA